MALERGRREDVTVAAGVRRHWAAGKSDGRDTGQQSGTEGEAKSHLLLALMNAAWVFCILLQLSEGESIATA